MKTRICLRPILFAALIFCAAKINAQVCVCTCTPVLHASVAFNAYAHGCIGGISFLVDGCQAIPGTGTIHRTEGGFDDIPLGWSPQPVVFAVPAGHYVVTYNYFAAINFCGCPGNPPGMEVYQLQQEVEVTEPDCDLTLAINTTPNHSVNNPDGSIHVQVGGTSCSGQGKIDVVNSLGQTSTYTINDGAAMDINGLAKGNYDVYYSYLDYAGNYICEIHVTDSVGCAHTILNCPGDFSVENDLGFCGAEVIWSPPTLECGCDYTVTPNHYPHEFFNVDSLKHVSYHFVLETGVEDSCGFDVVVYDLEDPVIDGPAQVDAVVDIPFDAFDDCGADVEFQDEFTITDNCPGQINRSFSIESGSFFEKGMTTVTLTATDVHGNTSSRNFTVNVIDVTPPELQVPAAITKDNYPGLCKASLHYQNLGPFTTDNCQGEVALTYDFADGQFITNGTVVHVTATDVDGNQTTEPVTIFVNDIDTPVVTFCPADIHVVNDEGACGAIVNYFLPTSTDNCDGVVAPLLGPGLPSGALFPVGNTMVQYSFTDVTGNVSVCTFNVRVDDIDPPTFIGANIIVNNDPGQCSKVINLGQPGVADNCGVAIGPIGPGGGLLQFPVGTTPLNYSATDVNGNVGFATFYVTVLDVEPPQFDNCPSNIVTNNTVVNWTEPMASDNCGDSIIQNHYPGDIFPLGTTQVIYVAIDPSGNTDTCKFNVTITSNCTATISPSGNVSICSGSNLTMQAITGSGLTYQWKKNGNNIPGATNSSYTTNKAASYTVVVTSTTCTATSASTVITVISTPSATITPSGNVTVCPGVALTFQANPGTGLTYQWTNSSGNIAGATGTSYSTSAKSTYKVIVANASGCSKTSMGVKFQNYPDASVKITPGSSLNICHTGSVTLNVKIVSGYTYQWYKDNAIIATATGSSYTATTAGVYNYVATTPNGCTKFSPSRTVTGCRLDGASSDSPGASSLNLYPNPSDGTFMLDVQLNNHFSGNGTMEIVNTIGQIIKQEVVEVNDGEINQRIHLENSVAAGIYFVKLMVNDEVLTSQLVIKR